MQVLNAGYTLVALACIGALGPQRREWLPVAAMAWAGAAAAVVLAAAWPLHAVLARLPWAAGLLAAVLAASLVLGLALWRSPELRQALRR